MTNSSARSLSLATRALAALTLTAGLGLAGSVVTAAPSQAAGACVSYQYGEGGSGDCVHDIQVLFNYEYPDQALVTDGQFGPNTEAGIRHLQADRQLAQVDGIVGHDTWDALCNSLKGPQPADVVAAGQHAGCPGY